jgi:MFS family permease
MVLEGTTDVQVVALAIDRLHLGNGGPGVLYLVWGAGGVAGSAVLLRIVRRTGYGRALLVGSLVFGLLLAVAGVGGVALVIAVMLPVGLGFALVEGSVMGVIPRLADDAVIGRVYGVTELLYSGAAAVGAALAPALIAWLGCRRESGRGRTDLRRAGPGDLALVRRARPRSADGYPGPRPAPRRRVPAAPAPSAARASRARGPTRRGRARG